MDTARYLFDLGSLSKDRSTSPPTGGNSCHTECDFAPPVIDLPQDNILYYVAGVCIKKVMKSHGKCDCITLLRVQNADFNSPNQVFTVCKAYSKFGDVFGALNIPSDNLVDLLTKCDSCCFIKTLQTIICVLFYAYQFFRR